MLSGGQRAAPGTWMNSSLSPITTWFAQPLGTVFDPRFPHIFDFSARTIALLSTQFIWMGFSFLANSSSFHDFCSSFHNHAWDMAPTPALTWNHVTATCPDSPHWVEMPCCNICHWSPVWSSLPYFSFPPQGLPLRSQQPSSVKVHRYDTRDPFRAQG